MKRKFAVWLLRVASKAEATAYRIDERAWATRWGR